MKKQKSINEKATILTTTMVLLMTLATFTLQAQTADKCIQKYGPDSTETLKQISLYRELFGQKKYTEAYTHWQYVFINAPCLYERTHAEGRTILNVMIEGTTDVKRRTELFDTLMLMYDARIMYFGKENYVKGFKGRDMIKYMPKNLFQGTKLLIESVNGEGNNSSEYVVNDLAQAFYNLWKSKALTDEEMVAMYERLSAIADFNLTNAKGEKDIEKWTITQTNVNSLFTPVLTCEKIVAIYKPKYDANPNDTVLLARIVTYLNLKNCSDDPFYLVVAEKMYEQKPDANAARALGDAFAGDKNLSKASFYFSKSVSMETDPMKKSADFLRLARISYERKNCQEARSYAMQALQQNPNEGAAYLLIGDTYALCASQCSDPFDQKTIYWAAVDKYQRAKSVDASVAPAANEKINLYSRYFPAKEECFFRGITEGQSYTITCWPSETTTVRF